MITAMKLSRGNELKKNLSGGFQKGAGSSPGGNSRGRPRRRSSLKPRTVGLVEGRPRRQSHRVSFANSIEVKEFGNSSNENTPTQGNLPTPASTVQISTPIEKLKRLQLAEEKSGISRLSIIPKCDTNFINDSDDFEPYVDSSPSHMKITTDLPIQQSVPQLRTEEGASSLLTKYEQSAQPSACSIVKVPMTGRQEIVENLGRDISTTRYNNSDMEFTCLTEHDQSATKPEEPSTSTPALSMTGIQEEAKEDISTTRYNNSDMELTLEDVSQASVGEVRAEPEVSGTHYNNSDMELTTGEDVSLVNVAEGGGLLQTKKESSSIAASSINPSDSVITREVQMVEQENTATTHIDSTMEITLEDVSQASIGEVRAEPEVSGTRYNNSDMELTTGEDVSLVYVAENDQAKKSSSSILESSINPPDSALTAMEVQVVDQNTKAIHSSDLELTSVADNQEKYECPPPIPVNSVNVNSTVSTVKIKMVEQNLMENTTISPNSNGDMELAVSETSQAQEAEILTSSTVPTKEVTTLVPPSTNDVLDKQPVLPSQSSNIIGPSSHLHFSKTSIPNEIAELEKLPGIQKSQPNMALVRKKRKSPRLVHVPRTMVTRSGASGGPDNDTFFNHVEYLRSRFLSIASSCFERLKNPTYVMGHPDFKEFLEVVINRANMGQSLLTLLINYGKIVGLSNEVVSVPVVSEHINENGPLESFEWIKKMVLELQQKWPDVEAALVSAADMYHWQVDLWSNNKIQVTIYNSARITFIINGGQLNSFPQRIVDIKVSYVRGSLMSSVPPVKSYSFTSDIAQLIWTVIKQKQ